HGPTSSRADSAPVAPARGTGLCATMPAEASTGPDSLDIETIGEDNERRRAVPRERPASPHGKDQKDARRHYRSRAWGRQQDRGSAGTGLVRDNRRGAHWADQGIRGLREPLRGGVAQLDGARVPAA